MNMQKRIHLSDQFWALIRDYQDVISRLARNGIRDDRDKRTAQVLMVLLDKEIGLRADQSEEIP